MDTADISNLKGFFDGIDSFNHLISMAGDFTGVVFSVQITR